MSQGSGVAGCERLLNTDRATRLDIHCDKVVGALLYGENSTKDIAFVCSDEVQVWAHRFVLGSQCRFFRGILYKSGDADVSRNSVWGKKYRFWESSRCLRMLLQFLYTGHIDEVEGIAGNSINDNLAIIEPLLVMSLTPNKYGLGGVDDYIIRRLVRIPPRTFQQAMERLNLGMKGNSQPILDSVMEALPQLQFTDQSFDVKDLLPECVELVLRDVFLDASELVVAQAVKHWAVKYFGVVDLSDDELEQAEPKGARREHLVYVPDCIQSLISLECISEYDIRRTVHRLRIFPRATLLDAIESLRSKGLAKQATHVNSARGQERPGRGQTHIESLPYDNPTPAENMQQQQPVYAPPNGPSPSARPANGHQQPQGYGFPAMQQAYAQSNGHQQHAYAQSNGHQQHAYNQQQYGYGQQQPQHFNAQNGFPLSRHEPLVHSFDGHMPRRSSSGGDPQQFAPAQRMDAYGAPAPPHPGHHAHSQGNRRSDSRSHSRGSSSRNYR